MEAVFSLLELGRHMDQYQGNDEKRKKIRLAGYCA